MEKAMALTELIPLFVSIHGRVGDKVLKQYGTKIVISRRPVFRNRKFTEAQRAWQERFRQAVQYANRLMADPRAREVYKQEAVAKGKPVRSLMIADFLNARPPQVALQELSEADKKAEVRHAPPDSSVAAAKILPQGVSRRVRKRTSQPVPGVHSELKLVVSAEAAAIGILIHEDRRQPNPGHDDDS